MFCMLSECQRKKVTHKCKHLIRKNNNDHTKKVDNQLISYFGNESN